MTRLTLQIDRECFVAIMTGKQTVEHRYIYPSNAKKYVVETDLPDGDFKVDCVKYDALYLINGRRKDAPRILVEVLGAEFVVFTDADGNDLTFVENGEEYLVCEVQYKLGKVLKSENCESMTDADKADALIKWQKKYGNIND